MIEIKKPGGAGGGTQLITETFDLVYLNVDFKLLNTAPFDFVTKVPNKTICPVSLTCKYYSIGTQTSAFYVNNKNVALNTTDAFFCWLSTGTVPDQSGLITISQYGAFQFSVNNNNANTTILSLWTAFNDVAANYNEFKISITYFLIDSL